MKSADARELHDAELNRLRNRFGIADLQRDLDAAISRWRRLHEKGDSPSPEVTPFHSLAGRLVAELEALTLPPVFPAELSPGRKMLSSREAQVAVLLGAGFTSRQTARILEIEVATIRRHTANIYEKLGVSNRHELRETLDEAIA